MRLLLDVTRTLLRFHNATPTGIDRVELAYIARLMEGVLPYEVHYVVSTPLGAFVITPERMAEIFQTITARWWSTKGATNDIYGQLAALLKAPIDTTRMVPVRLGTSRKDPWSIWPVFAGVARYYAGGRRRLSRLAAQADGTPTLYLHVSHIGLDAGRNFEWLRGSAVRAIFLVHDLIPIDYPEFCGDGAEAKHRRRMRTVSTFGKAIIVHSDYTKSRIEHHFAAESMPQPPVTLSWLSSEVGMTKDIVPLAAPLPYFVHVGTIEGRKNIIHLLNVWRRMVATRDPQTVPRLVIAGQRGWKSQNVFDVIDKSHEIANHVIEVAGLDDDGLASVVAGATGMLCPSLVEGFGLPSVEALRLGVPVIASDIPAYREILGNAAMLIDWTDGPGWTKAIERLAHDRDFRAERVAATRDFKMITWNDHVDTALKGATAAAFR